MRLTREEILALVNVLFFYRSHVDGNVSQLINELTQKLESVFTEEDEVEDGDSGEQDDEDEDEDNSPEPDDLLEAKVYHALPPLKTADGLLEFEAADDAVCLILDGEQVSENVICVEATSDRAFAVWCEESAAWDSYDVKRFPKVWKDKFQIGKVYGIA